MTSPVCYVDDLVCILALTLTGVRPWSSQGPFLWNGNSKNCKHLLRDGDDNFGLEPHSVVLGATPNSGLRGSCGIGEGTQLSWERSRNMPTARQMAQSVSAMQVGGPGSIPRLQGLPAPAGVNEKGKGGEEKTESNCLSKYQHLHLVPMTRAGHALELQTSPLGRCYLLTAAGTLNSQSA